MKIDFIKIVVVIIGFFFLSWKVFRNSNDDLFFYGGLLVLALYMFVAIKMVDKYVDNKEMREDEE